MIEISVFFAFLWIFGISFYYSRWSSARTDVGRGQVIMRDRPQTARPEQMRRKRNFDKILNICFIIINVVKVKIFENGSKKPFG